MNAFRLKPSTFPWPPIFYGLAVVMAVIFGQLRGMPSLPGLRGPFAFCIGVVLVFAGCWLGIWAFKIRMECREAAKSRRGMEHLVTRGPFRFTRNPVYLGYTLLTFGLGLVTGNSWFVVLALAAAIFTTLVAIRREENYMLARFGAEFERYCHQTRRWI